MAVFEKLPPQVRKVVKDNISQDEQIKMCLIASSSSFSSKDYVVITTKRILVMDERTMGCLGRAYVNIKENVPIDKIISIDFSSSFMDKLLRQLSMGIQIEGYKYLIKSANKKEVEKAADLISELAHLKTN
jgi:hypothetical protein